MGGLSDWMDELDAMWEGVHQQSLRDAQRALSGSIQRVQARGCAVHACPSVTDILNDPNIAQALHDLFAASNAAGVEMSFYITQSDKGQLYYSPTVPGTRDHVPDPGPVPGNAVAYVHTHPDVARGIPGYPAQSGDDRSRWAYYQIHDIILSSRGIYVRSYDDRFTAIFPWH